MEIDYFGEKTSQLSVEKMTAFGITIFTRYGKVYELMEMLEFCNKAARLDINEFVSELFYDSKACICNIKLRPDVSINSAIGQTFFDIAMITLQQFEWGGASYCMEQSWLDDGKT